MKLRQITLEECKALQYGQIVYEKGKYNSDGTPRRWKVTGKVKTWKHYPSRVRVPIKHGLYDYGYIDENNLNTVLVEE